VDLSAPLVFVDRASIERLLLQLVLYSADTVRPPCGAIEIRIAAAYAGAEFVHLTVTGNGEGMDAEAIHAVARWLEAPHMTCVDVSSRLRMVHRIVRGHGGRMSVEALPNAATTLRVELPALAPCNSGRSPPLPEDEE
jgi:hypothetical protein